MYKDIKERTKCMRKEEEPIKIDRFEKKQNKQNYETQIYKEKPCYVLTQTTKSWE